MPKRTNRTQKVKEAASSDEIGELAMHGVVGSVLLAYPQNNYEERVFWIDPTMEG